MARLKLAVAALVLAIGIALQLRAARYDALAPQVSAELAAIYQQTFPKSPTPENVLRTMRTEQSVLKGTRGGRSEAPTRPSSEATLENLLAALPTGMRFRVPEIRLEGDNIYLACEVRANADADAIAESVRGFGLIVDAPRTQRLASEGFSARITAKLASIPKGMK